MVGDIVTSAGEMGVCWVGMGDVSLRRVQADKYKKLGRGLGRIMIANFF